MSRLQPLHEKILAYYLMHGAGPNARDLRCDIEAIHAAERLLLEMGYLEGEIISRHAGNPEGLVAGKLSGKGFDYFDEHGVMGY
jgi:hypothetical protein